MDYRIQKYSNRIRSQFPRVSGAPYIFDIQTHKPRRIEFMWGNIESTWGNIESTDIRYKPGN